VGWQVLEQIIAPGAVVALDTMLFIYQVEESPTYWPVVRPVFRDVAAGRISAVTSVVSLLEVIVQPLRNAAIEVADQYEALLYAYPNLTLIDVNRAITRRAAELRATSRLRLPDAVQVATALDQGATYFLTNDYDLDSVSGIDVLLVDDFLPGGRPRAAGRQGR
jgi:predicted nucleic acid-binding protein